jgi:hypothetical protein
VLESHFELDSLLDQRPSQPVGCSGASRAPVLQQDCLKSLLPDVILWEDLIVFLSWGSTLLLSIPGG